MKLPRPILPAGVDADLAIAVVSTAMEAYARHADLALQFVYEFKGVHERTAVGDELQVSIRNRQKTNSLVKYALKRDSLYHILPEYLFHPLDRYSGCENDEEEFLKRYKAQEETVTHALAYFYPYDKTLQDLRIRFEDHLNEHILRDNHFIIGFLTEGFPFNPENPFIRAVYPCLLWLRPYRGYEKIIHTALQFAFANQIAAYSKEWITRQTPISDNCPCRLEGTLEELFCGDTFPDTLHVFKVSYQTEITATAQIEQLHRDLAEFESFFQDWFLGIRQRLEITFGDWKKIPVIGNGTSISDLFLNYNTQLIPSTHENEI